MLLRKGKEPASKWASHCWNAVRRGSFVIVWEARDNFGWESRGSNSNGTVVGITIGYCSTLLEYGVLARGLLLLNKSGTQVVRTHLDGDTWRQSRRPHDHSPRQQRQEPAKANQHDPLEQDRLQDWRHRYNQPQRDAPTEGRDTPSARKMISQVQRLDRPPSPGCQGRVARHISCHFSPLHIFLRQRTQSSLARSDCNCHNYDVCYLSQHEAWCSRLTPPV